MNKPINFDDFKKSDSAPGVIHHLEHEAYKTLIDMFKWSVKAKAALARISECDTCEKCKRTAIKALQNTGQTSPVK